MPGYIELLSNQNIVKPKPSLDINIWMLNYHYCSYVIYVTFATQVSMLLLLNKLSKVSHKSFITLIPIKILNWFCMKDKENILFEIE